MGNTLHESQENGKDLIQRLKASSGEETKTEPTTIPTKQDNSNDYMLQILGNHNVHAQLMLDDQDSRQLSGELEKFVQREPYPLNVSNFLADFKKQSAQELELGRYSVKRDSKRGAIPLFSNASYDAHYSFVLCYDEESIACISFDAQRGAILVPQIQGKFGSHDKLQPLKWERALLALVLDWAENNSIPEVRVTPYHKNIYEMVRSDERFKLLYDVTARRSGFTYDEDMDLYRKQTGTLATKSAVLSLR